MRLNQKGISLIELMVAASLTAIVALGGAYVTSHAQQTATFATVQNDIDRIHYLNIQKARNVDNIKALYGIDSAENTATDNNFLLCLHMDPSATDCASYSSLSHSLSEAIVLEEAPPNISSTVTVTPHCISSGCSYISVKVSTQYTAIGNAPSLNYAPRVSTSNLPNFLFIPRNQIDYTCSKANQVMVGIDYYKQKAICSDIINAYGATNTDQLPLLIYDSGSLDLTTPANTTDCPYGYTYAGFTDSICRPLGNLTTPVTVTTTIPSGFPTTTTTIFATTTTTTVSSTTTTMVSLIPINCMDDDPCTYEGQIHTEHGQACMCAFLGGNPHPKAQAKCHQQPDSSWILQKVVINPAISVNCM